MIAPCGCPPETFWTLMYDSAHWKFELFVGFVETVVLDGVIGYLGYRILWPTIKKHWKHHIDRDNQESDEQSRLIG